MAKVWCDGVVALECLHHFQANTSRLGERVEILEVGMDGHSPQATHVQECKDRMALFNIVPAYSPADCSDVIAPCDHHLGRRLKGVIGDFYQSF